MSDGWPCPVRQMKCSRSNRRRTYAGTVNLCEQSREQWVAYSKGTRTLFGQEVLSEFRSRFPRCSVLTLIRRSEQGRSSLTRQVV